MSICFGKHSYILRLGTFLLFPGHFFHVQIPGGTEKLEGEGKPREREHHKIHTLEYY